MGDVFKEQIVKRHPSFTDNFKRVGLIIAAMIITIIAFTIIPPFAPFLMAAAFFGAWFVMSFLRKEFEYSFTSGELDIDVIYNRSRRKRQMSIRVSDIEIMAHIDNKTHTGSFSNAQLVLDFSSGQTAANTYAFMINHQGKRTKVIIEPNEVMLKALAGVLTRRKLHYNA